MKETASIEKEIAYFDEWDPDAPGVAYVAMTTKGLKYVVETFQMQDTRRPIVRDNITVIPISTALRLFEFSHLEIDI